MSTSIGFLLATLTALLWGSYLVPMKRLKEYDPMFYQFVICSAVLLSSVAVTFAFGSFTFSNFAILSGILWGTGNVISLYGVKYAGLSRSPPVVAGLVALLSFLWGILFLREAVSSLLLGTLGIIALISGIWLVSQTANNGGTDIRKGIIYSLISGILFGTYLVPLKLSGLEPLQFLFPMSLGVFICGLAVFIAKRPIIDKNIIAAGIFSGVMWNTANLMSFYVILTLGLGIGLPITQVGLFVAIMWGLLYFREIYEKRSIAKLVIGAATLFAGVLLLAGSI